MGDGQGSDIPLAVYQVDPDVPYSATGMTKSVK